MFTSLPRSTFLDVTQRSPKSSLELKLISVAIDEVIQRTKASGTYIFFSGIYRSV